MELATKHFRTTFEAEGMSEKLTVEFPSQGWRQILTSQKKILDDYDQALEQGRARKVATAHGNIFEAAVRSWLQDFLPKGYGVTSGFVISAGRKSNVKAPHFDVIIYNQLDAPILWMEGNSDNSSQGRPRAIPVEHIHLVLEAKATFSSRNVKKAIEHLGELSPLLAGLDSPTDRYKLHLPETFCCGLVFGEARETNMRGTAPQIAWDQCGTM
jgi:hypothetical protein